MATISHQQASITAVKGHISGFRKLISGSPGSRKSAFGEDTAITTIQVHSQDSIVHAQKCTITVNDDTNRHNRTSTSASRSRGGSLGEDNPICGISRDNGYIVTSCVPVPCRILHRKSEGKTPRRGGSKGGCGRIGSSQADIIGAVARLLQPRIAGHTGTAGIV